MQNEKLSLADFKAKAENVNENELLNDIQGGSWSDCHGYWGQLRKIIIYDATGIDEGIEWRN